MNTIILKAKKLPYLVFALIAIILALTANTMVHQIAEYIGAGMDNHLAKPVKKKILFQVMADALSGVD